MNEEFLKVLERIRGEIWMLRWAVIFSAVMVSCSISKAHAVEYGLYLGAHSFHVKDNNPDGTDHVEDNQLIGAQINDFTFATFTNSHGDTSYAASWSSPAISFNDSFRLRLIAGLVKGYYSKEAAHDVQVQPYLLPALEYDITSNITGVLGWTPDVAALSVRWMFGHGESFSLPHSTHEPEYQPRDVRLPEVY
jgi:hypothetical protein